MTFTRVLVEVVEGEIDGVGSAGDVDVEDCEAWTLFRRREQVRTSSIFRRTFGSPFESTSPDIHPGASAMPALTTQTSTGPNEVIAARCTASWSAPTVPSKNTDRKSVV